MNDVPVVNVQTDRILLATATGLIQCLREADLPFPVVHYEMEAAPPVKGPAKPATEGQDPQQPEKPADPFGNAPDPFAAGGTRPAAAPAAGGAAADPFGTTP
jgi:hypothetical protein